MATSDPQHPQILTLNHYPLWYRVYLQILGATFRTILPFALKDPGLFDFEERVPTRGLGTGSCLVRVFLPLNKGDDIGSTSSSPQIPLIIHLEGGGFVMGQPADSAYNMRYLADSVNAAVVSVDYAKAPAHPFPHALLQIPYVIAWSCKRLPVSIEHVAIGGNSAGGNLSAAFSLLNSFKSLRDTKMDGNGEGGRDSPLKSLPETFKLRSQFLLVPSVRQGTSYAERRDDSTSEEMKKASLPTWVACAMEDAYLPPPIDRKSPFVAPDMISEESLRSLVNQKMFPSRALVITAGLDCLSVEAGRFADKLNRAGVKVERKQFEGATHIFDHANGWDGKAKTKEAEMANEAYNLIARHLIEGFKDE